MYLLLCVVGEWRSNEFPFFIPSHLSICTSCGENVLWGNIARQICGRLSLEVVAGEWERETEFTHLLTVLVIHPRRLVATTYYVPWHLDEARMSGGLQCNPTIFFFFFFFPLVKNVASFSPTVCVHVHVHVRTIHQALHRRDRRTAERRRRRFPPISKSSIGRLSWPKQRIHTHTHLE